MTEDQYIDLLASFEPIFEQAAQLACDLREGVATYSKSQTGVEGVDIVTEADFKVQEFILAKLAETPLVECELFAEEKTPSTSLFKGTNGLVLTIDPIDGTAKYVSGGNFFSTIVGLHNKKDLLYTYYRFPSLKWTRRIIKNVSQDVGSRPEILTKPDIMPQKTIAYLEYTKPEKIPADIEEKLKAKGLSLRLRKEIVDEGNMVSLVFLDKVAGTYVNNPVAYDCLGMLHYARAAGEFEIYSTVDLTKPTMGKYGIYYPGWYVVWKK